MNKLDIKVEMREFDNKNREFYDSLSDEEKKKFSTYMILKWGANVNGSAEYQEWYLRATNERVNKNFFDLGKHPKLQWLTLTTVSPGLGAQAHYWISGQKKYADPDTNKKIKFIENQYPNLSTAELELMAAINSMDNLRELARQLGWDDIKIKSEL
jgi:hypothetical protein